MEKDNEEKKEKKEKTILGEIWEWTYCILLAVFVTILVKNLLFSTTIVRKESMVPTLQDGDILFVNRLAQVTSEPLERGDIVVLEAPIGDIQGSDIAYYTEDSLWTKFLKLFKKTLYIKRVIGLPGEVIKIEGDDVSINGEIIDENYTNPDNRMHSNVYDQQIDIPEGYVFCIGDNRGSSMDSRHFGLIPINKIEGKATFRLYPFNKFGNIE